MGNRRMKNPVVCLLGVARGKEKKIMRARY